MTWGMIGGAAVSLIGGSLLGDSGGHGGSTPSKGQVQVYDPYAPYRGAAAQQLNALMADPSTLQNLPEYKAQMQAAARTMAAQGYTGSGNALVAAANAGGQAYQQAFNNLAMLSGAGTPPGYGAGMAQQGNAWAQQQNGQMWGQIGNAVGQGINSLFGGGEPSVQVPTVQIPIDVGSPSMAYPTVPNIPLGGAPNPFAGGY